MSINDIIVVVCAGGMLLFFVVGTIYNLAKKLVVEQASAEKWKLEALNLSRRYENIGFIIEKQSIDSLLALPVSPKVLVSCPHCGETSSYKTNVAVICSLVCQCGAHFRLGGGPPTPRKLTTKDIQ